jgi:hypothetical protein
MLPQEDAKMSVKGKQNRRKSHQKKLEKKKKCKRNAASRNPHLAPSRRFSSIVLWSILPVTAAQP